MSKASLVKELNDRGIPIPKGAKVADLQHRVDHWLTGWVAFATGEAGFTCPSNPVTLIDTRTPFGFDSRMARMVVASKLVFVMGRCAEPPNDVPTLDVPTDFNTRWPEQETPIESDWGGEEE